MSIDLNEPSLGQFKRVLRTLCTSLPNSQKPQTWISPKSASSAKNRNICRSFASSEHASKVWRASSMRKRSIFAGYSLRTTRWKVRNTRFRITGTAGQEVPEAGDQDYWGAGKCQESLVWLPAAGVGTGQAEGQAAGSRILKRVISKTQQKPRGLLPQHLRLIQT